MAEDPYGEDRREPTPVNLGPSGKAEDYSGFVIVRLGAEASGGDFEQLHELAANRKLGALARVLEELGRPASQPVIRSIRPSEVNDLERRAAQTERRAAQTDLPRLRSLTAYWRLDLRDHPGDIDQIVARLNEMPEVDLAYRELAVSDPIVNDIDDTYAVGQTYLDPAPTGFDARWAWTQPNGEGAGVAVVDLEQGWFLTHEDLAGTAPTLIYGDNRDGVGTYKGNHGTAVLGEIAADDNTVGVVGGAPTVSSVRVTSHYDAATDTALHVADALVAAVAALSPGDVLLLEVQRSYKPTEIDDADFDAIQLASALGIIVVEAAGNGDADLDAYTSPSGHSILNRGSADFRESGAIMVGSAVSAVPHERYVGCGVGCGSNYGSRIDCYGWGQNITTAGYGNLDAGTGDDSTYTDNFGGTSGASPMITAAALIVQGMYQATTGTRLTPEQMRSLLSNPATGTPQGTVVAGNIGVMPDLRAVITSGLGLVPDIYLRDNIGDTGAVPIAGPISASPDVIVRPSTVADGTVAFGQGSGTENDAGLGFEAEGGQDNFIYVRMKNRGMTNAAGATATVYWSEVSTLVTPDMWNLIGASAPIDVPQGDTLVVADPITWAAAEIPGTGHYCFVAMVSHPQDPAPPLPPGPPTFDWDAFRAYIQNQNNVTWRNFNVVDELPDPSADPAPMPFIIAGTPKGDRDRVFDLEIVQQLPPRAELWLEVPLALAGQLTPSPWWKTEIDRKAGAMHLRLPTQRRSALYRVRLAAGSRHRCRFILRRPQRTPLDGNGLAIRQLFERDEVGRVTWTFRRRKHDDRS
jgi:serine protease